MKSSSNRTNSGFFTYKKAVDMVHYCAFFQPTVGKGWYSSYPGDSCKDIYDSGDARGDGEYWIDPEKTGNPLKVFCDMTRAGGEY